MQWPIPRYIYYFTFRLCHKQCLYGHARHYSIQSSLHWSPLHSAPLCPDSVQSTSPLISFLFIQKACNYHCNLLDKQCEKIAHADDRMDLYPNPAIIYIPFWTRTQSAQFCAKIKFQNCFLYLLQTYNFIRVLHILKTAPKLKSNYWNTHVRFNMFNFVSIKFAFRLTTSQRMQCYNFRMRAFSQLHTQTHSNGHKSMSICFRRYVCGASNRFT